MDLSEHIKDGKLKIIVKPNSPKSEITGYDEARCALKVNIHAQPDKGKANVEVVKFFSKSLKKKVGIVTGLSSREKILKIG